MLQTLSNEHIIDSKINLFKAGMYDVLVLSEKQIRALEILTDQETAELLFGGAAGGAKSWLGCEWLLWSCLAYPKTRWFIGRHHLSEIRETTMETFKRVCAKHKIPSSWWRYSDGVVKVTFSNGSVIKGVELMQKPGDLEFERFGSSEYTGGWIEEGGGVAAKAYEIARTRINRILNDFYGLKGKLLITGNPARNWMYSGFYLPDKKGVLAPDKKFLQSLIGDNPFKESGYEEILQSLTGASRQRLLLGNWDFIDDVLQLIDSEAIQDLFTNDFVKPDTTQKSIIIDVAMEGGDSLVISVFYGKVLMEYRIVGKSGGNQIVRMIKDLQAKHGVRASMIVYDADGIGAFIGGKGGFIPGAIPFHANASPVITTEVNPREKDKKQQEKSEYATLKDQCGYLLADDINEGLMWAKAVHSQEDMDRLASELSFIKRASEVQDGPLRLMKKSEIKKQLGWSPDFSDTFLMRKYLDVRSMNKRTYQRPVRSF